MSDKIEGYLEIGQSIDGEDVLINLPQDMTGHIKLSPSQAKHLAGCLLKQADEIFRAKFARQERERIAAIPPVDRSNRTLADGSPVTADHRELQDNGQQKGYVVLSNEERAKGFVRPVRTIYRHLKCGGITSMGRSIAETYARDPKFYSGTFCYQCGAHFPLMLDDGTPAFKWIDDGTGVGE